MRIPNQQSNWLLVILTSMLIGSTSSDCFCRSCDTLLLTPMKCHNSRKHVSQIKEL